MTKVLARTIANFLKSRTIVPARLRHIGLVEVLNWYNPTGFSSYAEEALKRYCLWRVTSLAQHRGNLYRDSLSAKQLETIAACGFANAEVDMVVARMKRSAMRE
jgi:hypothetical protein